jgi:hypothetical protein
MILRTSIGRTRLLVSLLIILTSYKTGAQVFDFENSRAKTVTLDGQWRFNMGDDPDGKLGWANPQFDDSKWTLLNASQPWGEQGYKVYGGFAWYRFKVMVPAGSAQLGILIPRLRTSYQI